MKKLLPFAILATMLLGCKKEETTKQESSNKIIVGLSADYPPFEFFKDGTIVGFDVALINALAKKIGSDVEIKDMNFDSIIGALQTKRIDVAISSLSATEERKKSVDFTDPYYSGSISVVYLQDNEIKNTEDLKGKIIGLQTGSIYEPYVAGELTAKLGKIETKSLPKIPDLIQDLKSKRITCILLGTTEANRLVKEQPDLTVTQISAAETELAIALPKGSPLKDKLNQALEEMKADGSIDKLIKEWLF